MGALQSVTSAPGENCEGDNEKDTSLDITTDEDNNYQDYDNNSYYR